MCISRGEGQPTLGGGRRAEEGHVCPHIVHNIFFLSFFHLLSTSRDLTDSGAGDLRYSDRELLSNVYCEALKFVPEGGGDGLASPRSSSHPHPPRCSPSPSFPFNKDIGRNPQSRPQASTPSLRTSSASLPSPPSGWE